MLLEVVISILFLPNLWQNHLITNDFINFENKSEIEVKAPQRIYTNTIDVKITAQSVLAVDVASGKILYERNSLEKRPIASLTKLMTALVFLDYNPGWQEEFYTIASDRRNGGIIHLNTGEILTIKDLFYTALIASDNDAAMALSRSTGLSEEEFVDKMNDKAHYLNLSNTEFVEPTGLNYNNQSTAKDIATLLKEAMDRQEIREATSLAAYEFEVITQEKKRLVKLYNTDWLVNGYLDIVGGKTGHLEKAGYCLATKIKGPADQEIIIVALGSESNFDRFQDIKAIADWIFNNYQWR